MTFRGFSWTEKLNHKKITKPRGANLLIPAFVMHRDMIVKQKSTAGPAYHQICEPMEREKEENLCLNAITI